MINLSKMWLVENKSFSEERELIVIYIHLFTI